MDRPRDRRPDARSALSRAAAAGARGRPGRRRWWKPPRRLRPTRAGWIFFALTLGVGGAALNTGNNLLYLVLAALLAFLTLSGVFSESALRGIQVTRRLPRELFAETPSRVVLEIANRQRRVPAFAVVVEDVIGGDPERGPAAGRVFALRVAPGGRERRAYPLAAPRRGPLGLAGFRVSTRFPFGLFSKSMTLPAPRRALVYPKVSPRAVRARASPPAGTPGARSAARGGEAAEAAGLRAFAHGDPPRRVHWRASLRRGGLFVREPDREARRERVIALRTRGVPAGAGFEQAVRRAASEAVAHLAAGDRVGLRTDGATLAPECGPRQRALLLRHLAEVAPEDPPPTRASEKPPSVRSKRGASPARSEAKPSEAWAPGQDGGASPARSEAKPSEAWAPGQNGGAR